MLQGVAVLAFDVGDEVGAFGIGGEEIVVDGLGNALVGVGVGAVVHLDDEGFRFGVVADLGDEGGVDGLHLDVGGEGGGGEEREGEKRPGDRFHRQILRL